VGKRATTVHYMSLSSNQILPVLHTGYRVTKQPAKSQQDTPEISELDSFNKYIESLQDWERNLLRKIGNTRNVDDMVQSIIQSDTAYMVSDGGLVNGYGSFGWIIANETELIKGRGKAEGLQDLMQSFRAKGYGMLAALLQQPQVIHALIWD
jgi:hypothetical protein